METMQRERDALILLYQSSEQSITKALEARISFSEKEIERFKEYSRTLQVKMTSGIGQTIAKSSQDALSKHIKLIETKTIAGIVSAGLIAIGIAYSLGNVHGFHSGSQDAQFKADQQMAAFRATANEAVKLFLDRPEELALWAPIIRLNQLNGSSRLRDCYGRFLFSFSNRPDQPGCWLPLRIPVPLKRPQSMSLQFLPPAESPDSPDQ